MFGRKKKDEAPDAPPASAPPPVDRDAMRDMTDRMAAMMPEIQILSQTGRPGVATVNTCELQAEFQGNREYAVTATIQPDEGPSFTATFPVFRIAGLPEPAAGESIHVFFDPDDHTRVVKRPDRMAPRIRWHVPELCPECGARVDQSTEALAEHPTCHFCHAPLPCEPIGS